MSDCTKQFYRFDRLGYVTVSPDQAVFLLIEERFIGRQRNDRNPGNVAVELPNRPGRDDSIHSQHLEINEHDIVGVPLNLADNVLAILGNLDEVAGPRQEIANDLLVDRVVLGQQNTKPLAARLDAGLRPRNTVGYPILIGVGCRIRGLVSA